jgi:pyruvate,water dikinase
LNIYSNKLAQEMLPGQIKPLVWSINIPLVNGTWIEILSEITGQLDVRPEDLAKSFYYRTYFNIAALSEIFREFGLSTEALEILMLSRDDSKPSFKPGIKTLRHSFRIAKFIHHKLTFEEAFIREYNRLRIFYKEAGRKVLNEFSLSSYPQLYSQLFEEGHNLTYLNIVAPLLMQVYNKRLKNKLKKLGLDYDLLDFSSDFPELQALSPLSSLIKIKSNINSLPDEVKSECTSFEMLKKFPEASKIIDDIFDFIKEFGHLSESGNDFSVPKWEEDPENLFKLIMKTESVETTSGFFTFNELDRKGISRISGLRRSYLKAGRFKVYREQISSLFIYGHGLFRSLFLNLGRVFNRYEIIASAEDIFYLNIKEINNILAEISSEKAKSYDDVITLRKNEMEATRDFVLPSIIYGEQAPILEIGKLKNHFGIGTSAGFYTGKTRVIKGINDFNSVIKGDVILIPFSDVSWTPILTLAGAIVSETGGLLSHCSIIAREMGIPALVSVENACTIGNGLKVTVDGSNGILTIHDYE